MMIRYWTRIVTMEFIHTLQCIFVGIHATETYMNWLKQPIHFNSVLKGFVH